jgi:hypothetical protein
MPVSVRFDSRRGCGFRKPGGLYLVSAGAPVSCGIFPIYLDVCPCCGAGIKPTRGWTWVDGSKLAEDAVCLRNNNDCRRCILAEANRDKLGKCGLLWIGEAFYKTPDEFLNEAARMGISRRIPAVPNDFVLGKTWVLLAHRSYEVEIVTHANIPTRESKEIHKAAIFGVFMPAAIEYVVTGKESAADIKALEKRGLTPVKIKRKQDQPELI